MYQLIIHKGPQTGLAFALNEDLIIIGRSPICDIVIDDVEISRQHLRLKRTSLGYNVQDMGSTNGTFIDGRRFGGDAYMLKPGQTLAIGNNVLLIYKTGNDLPPPPSFDSQPNMVALGRPTVPEAPRLGGISHSSQPAHEILADLPPPATPSSLSQSSNSSAQSKQSLYTIALILFVIICLLLIVIGLIIFAYLYSPRLLGHITIPLINNELLIIQNHNLIRPFFMATPIT